MRETSKGWRDELVRRQEVYGHLILSCFLLSVSNEHAPSRVMFQPQPFKG